LCVPIARTKPADWRILCTCTCSRGDSLCEMIHNTIRYVASLVVLTRKDLHCRFPCSLLLEDLYVCPIGSDGRWRSFLLGSGTGPTSKHQPNTTPFLLLIIGLRAYQTLNSQYAFMTSASLLLPFMLCNLTFRHWQSSWSPSHFHHYFKSKKDLICLTSVRSNPLFLPTVLLYGRFSALSGVTNSYDSLKTSAG
jgi:hypothetical protein